MEKADSSRQVSNWESLNRDILELIFAKLNTRDLTKGASRVCISWFLASHSKTLWNTVDLAKPRQVDQGLLWNIITKIIEHFDFGETGRILKNVTKLSRSVPKNLFFGFDYWVLEEDLMFAAERMPNIEKLVLPRRCLQTKKSMGFAFSQWKNLKTLIIAHDDCLTGTFQFQAVGENCSNLTNLKYMGDLELNIVKQIVDYLKNIKKLSLRCSSVRYVGVFWLIARLENLTVLNLSHCKMLKWGGRNDTVSIDELVHAVALMKLDKLIVCSTNDCKVCEDRPVRRMWSYGSKHWRNDEIKEFEF